MTVRPHSAPTDKLWRRLNHRAYLTCMITASLSLSVRLSVCLSVCLFVCLSLCVSVCVCLSVRLSVRMSVCLHVCLSVSVCTFVSLSVCLSISVCDGNANQSTFHFTDLSLQRHPLALSGPTKYHNQVMLCLFLRTVDKQVCFWRCGTIALLQLLLLACFAVVWCYKI